MHLHDLADRARVTGMEAYSSLLLGRHVDEANVIIKEALVSLKSRSATSIVLSSLVGECGCLLDTWLLCYGRK